MTSKPVRNKPSPALSPPDWGLLGAICEGLAFGPRALRPAVRPVAEAHDLGPRGAWILNLIDNGHVYPRDLAAIFGIGRSLITAELNRLTAAGLISATPGTADKRRTQLALTASGAAACRQIRDELQRRISANLAGYCADEIALFARMLADARGGAGAR